MSLRKKRPRVGGGKHMTTKEVKICAYCSGKMVNYTHTLSRILAVSLEKFAFYSMGKEAKLFNMTLSETTNFQKLRYWGLVRKCERSGYWQITELGFRFLYRKAPVPEKAITFRGKRISFDGPGRFFDKLVGHRYQRREEYAEQAKPAGTQEVAEQLVLA